MKTEGDGYEMKKAIHKAKILYIWFDTEYSTLELEQACLLQVAALITDGALRRVLPQEQDVRLAIRLPEGKELDSWVEQNLSDLVKTCRSPESVELSEADERLAAHVDSAAGPPAKREDQRPFLAGNSLHADWWLVRRFLHRFLSRLHYRHLDVTSIKIEWLRLHPGVEFDKEDHELIRQYFPEAVLPASGSRHDAYYDIQASIAELAFYRRHLFNI
jgi:oligoribonuclease